MMDDTDFDHIIDVPDTPDRLSARLRSHNSGKECISSRVGCLLNSGSLDRDLQNLAKDEVRVVDRTGPSRRPFIRPPRRISSASGSVECSNTIILSPSDTPCNSQGRSCRIKTNQSSEQDNGRISVARCDIHQGQAVRPSSASEDGAAMRSACNTVHGTTFPFCESGDKCKKTEGETNRDNSHHRSNSFQVLASKSGKGKEKVDEIIYRGNGSAMGHGKEINFPSVSFNNNIERNSPKRFLEPHDVSSPRAVRQKRLVRNGCISPHNIATKTTQLDGENSNSLKNFGPLALDRVSGSSQCWPEEKALTGDGNGGRDKGKGILNPCSSRDHGARAISTSSRNPVITGIDAACPADINVEDFNESQSGWRSTRNNTNNMAHSSSTLKASSHQRGSLTGSSIMTCKDIPQRKNRLCLNKSSSRSDVPENMEAERATSRLPPCASTAVTRQTKSGLRSRNDVHHDSVVLLEDSPDLSSARRPSHRSNPIIEIDEFSPEVRRSGSERAGPSAPNHLDDTTARQMEADEMLARELQEQFYNETLSTELAQVLHEDRNQVAPTNAVGHRRTSVNRGASTTRARRQPQPELRQGLSSFRRRGRIASMRSQQPRTRRQTSRRPSSLAGGRGPHFPSDMDLDMRIDVLEALEATLGDMDDIFEASGNIFQMQRDFNEDDYEMLLALDENVHQAGASSRQINNLPESKVQSTTMCEETCAICLENPAIGETIRHLPCFHKFHKDCIDPWLSRSTSCPVCKSSIS